MAHGMQPVEALEEATMRMAARTIGWGMLSLLVACSGGPALPSEEQVLADARAEWQGRVGITGFDLEWIQRDPDDGGLAHARLRLEGRQVHALARLNITYSRVDGGWRVARQRIQELRN